MVTQGAYNDLTLSHMHTCPSSSCCVDRLCGSPHQSSDKANLFFFFLACIEHSYILVSELMSRLKEAELKGSLWLFPNGSISKRMNWQGLKLLSIASDPCLAAALSSLRLWQMTSSLLDTVGEDVQVALIYIFYLGCGNYHWKSHLAVHQKNMQIFVDLTMTFLKCCISVL